MIHPIQMAFECIDPSIKDRMMGKGSPGGATNAYGVRRRNDQIEIFERENLTSVCFCNDIEQAYHLAESLNTCLISYMLATESMEPRDHNGD